MVRKGTDLQFRSVKPSFLQSTQRSIVLVMLLDVEQCGRHVFPLFADLDFSAAVALQSR